MSTELAQPERLTQALVEEIREHPKRRRLARTLGRHAITLLYAWKDDQLREIASYLRWRATDPEVRGRYRLAAGEAIVRMLSDAMRVTLHTNPNVIGYQRAEALLLAFFNELSPHDLRRMIQAMHETLQEDVSAREKQYRAIRILRMLTHSIDMVVSNQDPLEVAGWSMSEEAQRCAREFTQAVRAQLAAEGTDVLPEA